MRVGPYPQQNMPRQVQKPRPQQNRYDANEATGLKSPAMLMAQRILQEQGETQAGYFLYAIRPFIAPAELASIEQHLNVRSRRDPALDAVHVETANKKQLSGGGMDPQMIQLLMGLMNSKSTPDLTSIFKLINGVGK